MTFSDYCKNKARVLKLLAADSVRDENKGDAGRYRARAESWTAFADGMPAGVAAFELGPDCPILD